MKRHTIIAGVGAGKVINSTGDDTSAGITLEFPAGDRTLIEVTQGAEDTTGEDTGSKVKRGTFYMVAKDLQATKPLKVTGFDVETNATPGSFADL